MRAVIIYRYIFVTYLCYAHTAQTQRIGEFICDTQVDILFQYAVDFRSDQSKGLRLFLTWNPQDSIQKVTEKMNLFEQFHIVLEEQTIIIE